MPMQYCRWHTAIKRSQRLPHSRRPPARPRAAIRLRMMDGLFDDLEIAVGQVILRIRYFFRATRFSGYFIMADDAWLPFHWLPRPIEFFAISHRAPIVKKSYVAVAIEADMSASFDIIMKPLVSAMRSFRALIVRAGLFLALLNTGSLLERRLLIYLMMKDWYHYYLRYLNFMRDWYADKHDFKRRARLSR